jgi:hypothetical protein
MRHKEALAGAAAAVLLLTACCVARCVRRRCAKKPLGAQELPVGGVVILQDTPAAVPVDGQVTDKVPMTGSTVVAGVLMPQAKAPGSTARAAAPANMEAYEQV